MFFFGAFSGNLIYLILAISSLAGCSAMVFRGSDDQSEKIQISENASVHILDADCLPNSYANYHIFGADYTQGVISKEVTVQPPLIPFSRILFIPPLLTDKSHFSGSALFSRPPPIFLV